MQFIFEHGDELFHQDGTSDKHVALRALGESLPNGMFARYHVVYHPDGTERVVGRMQARSRHGRRSFYDNSESSAQARLLKWASRILRERTKS